MSFEDLGLSPETLRAIREAGYSEPTPIQQKAIHYVLMGRDVLGVAQTGTGKTAGFTLPMIDILSAGRARARMPRSLILEPTRELATQVSESFEKYGRYSTLSMALLIGGESMRDQQILLQRGVDVLIATPGRLLDLYDRGQILLADVKVLVIDEADRMLDMGFIPDVERIVSLLPQIRQTLFFSATMAPEIRLLADRFLMNPKEISVAPPASPAETVTQRLVRLGAEPKFKRAGLRALLKREAEEMRSALVFCNRKRDVDVVARSLRRHDFDAEALHGDMAQPTRTATLARFKQGEVKILVCSDVAARGLDITAVSHVFNYDVPVNAEDYVHRIGRTGRAGRSGKAFTLATPADSKLLAALTRLIGRAIPEEAAPVESVAAGTVAGAPGEPAEIGKERPRRGRGGGRSREAREGRESRRPGSEQQSRESDMASARRPAHAAASRRRDFEPQDEREPAPGESPFGEHVPAFLLRPVQLSASG